MKQTKWNWTKQKNYILQQESISDPVYNHLKIKIWRNKKIKTINNIIYVCWTCQNTYNLSKHKNNFWSTITLKSIKTCILKQA